MMNILLFPFRLLGSVLGFVGHLIGSIFSLVFSLMGGLFSLIFWGALICSIGGLVISLVHHHHKDDPHQDEPENHAGQDDFISYYDKDAVK